MDLNNDLALTDRVSHDYVDPVMSVAENITLDKTLWQTLQAAAGDAPLPKEQGYPVGSYQNLFENILRNTCVSDLSSPSSKGAPVLNEQWQHLGSAQALVEDILQNTCISCLSSPSSKELAQREPLSVVNDSTCNKCPINQSNEDMVTASEYACLKGNENSNELIDSESCFKMEAACKMSGVHSDERPATETVIPCPEQNIDALDMPNDYHNASRNVLTHYSAVYQSTPEMCKVGNKTVNSCFELSPIAEEKHNVDDEGHSISSSASSLLKEQELDAFVLSKSRVAASSTRKVIYLDSDTEIEKSPEQKTKDIVSRSVVFKDFEVDKANKVPVLENSSLQSNFDPSATVTCALQIDVPNVMQEKTAPKKNSPQLSTKATSPVLTSIKDDLRRMISQIAQQAVKPSALVAPFRLSSDSPHTVDDEDHTRVVVLSQSISNSKETASVQAIPNTASIPSGIPAVRPNTTAPVCRPKVVAVRPSAKASACKSQGIPVASAGQCHTVASAVDAQGPISDTASVISQPAEESDNVENQRVCVDDDTELIRMTKERWSTEGVQCPNINLTHAGYFRRQHINSNKVRGTLEGSFILTPLIDNLTNVNKGGVKRRRNMSDDDDDERASKRMRPDNATSATNNQAMIQYQLEKLSQITERSLREILLKETEAKDFVIRRHRCQLAELEYHQKSELMLLWHGCQFPRLLRTRLSQMFSDHKSQRHRLQNIHRQEIEVISTDAKHEMCEVEEHYDGKGAELRARLNSNQQNPYTTVTLAKAPCRSSNYKHTTVQVCLPEDIAHSIVMEDIIYDAFYSDCA